MRERVYPMISYTRFCPFVLLFTFLFWNQAGGGKYTFSVMYCLCCCLYVGYVCG